MTPYIDFLYFGILLLYIVVPTLLFSPFKQLTRFWLVIATVIMLVIQYSGKHNLTATLQIMEFVTVLGFALLEWLVAGSFLLLRKRLSNRWVFYLALALGLAPLLVTRIMVFSQPDYPLIFAGLSYVTFRSLDVIFGIQDGLIHSLPPAQYLTFLLFFPTISSGPIDRYQRFAEDWKRDRTRAEFLADLDGAIHRVFTGFLYKFILAALIKQYWLDPVSHGMDYFHVGSYMYAYTFYLFFDFAGYSAFAVGFSYLFGIHTSENFNRPFLSRDMRDFWNRWHMSLSFWFRDHIYNRFVFAALKGHWFKNRYTASYLGYMLTMGLMGIWHGTALHYLIYGLYHGLLLSGTDWLSQRYKKNRLLNDNGFVWRAASILLTFHLVAFGLLIFSGRLF
jgi:membrane protein involved in D-alanine export